MSRGMPPPRPPQQPRRPASPRTPPKQQPKQQPRTDRTGGQQRQAEQQRRQAEQRRIAQQKQAEQQRRAAKSAQQRSRQQQQYFREQHGARRHEEAARLTAEVQERVAQLESILAIGLRRSAAIDLDVLRAVSEPPPFDPGPLATPTPEPAWEEYAPGRLSGLVGGRSRQEERESAAHEAYEHAVQQWERAEQERTRQLAAARHEHEARVAGWRQEADRYADRLARVAAGRADRDPRVVESFLRTVLRRVPLPADFPRRAEVTHDSAGEVAVVRMVLPRHDVVPEVSGYEYEEAPDEVRPVPRLEDESRRLYRSVVDQVTLLVVRDVLEAEPDLAAVEFSGVVDRAAPAAGPDPVCLVSLVAYRDVFARLDLGHEPPEDCLAYLEAQVSPDPYAYQPVPAAAGV